MTSPSYLDLAGFKALSMMPESDVDALEALYAGWIDRQLLVWSRKIDSRLGKQYATPFVSPFPEVVTEWLAQIVTVRAFLRRGVDPTDAQFAAIKADADEAVADIKEAADSVNGLFELPLTSATSAQGMTRGGPRGYSEASPYVGFDIQADVGRDEDAAGSGTRG